MGGRLTGAAGAIIAGSLAAGGLCAPSLAQPLKDGAELDELVVTAEHRAISLQELPVAASVVSAQRLTSAGVVSFRDLPQAVPGLIFNRGNTTIQPNIRGVATHGSAPADESMVAVYVDGVYQASHSAIDFDFLSVKNVEVMRGPQGTLFGRNATGGLINVITLDPSDQPSARVKITGGSFAQRSGQLYATGPISSNINADISASIYDDGGYNYALRLDKHVGERHTRALRSKINVKVNDRSNVTVVGNYSRTKDSSGVVNQPLNGNTVAKSRPNPLIPSQPWQTALSSESELTGAGYEAYSIDFQSKTDLDALELQTTATFQHANVLSLSENEQTIPGIQRSVFQLPEQYYLLEARLLSQKSPRLNWIVGANYFGGWGKGDPLLSYSNNALVLNANTRQGVSSIAAFADGTFDVSNSLTLTAGIRYTSERRNFRAVRGETVLVPKRKADFQKVTYRAILAYKIDDDINAYLSLNRGFKTGIFNTFATAPAASNPVNPEVLDSYEAGVKYSKSIVSINIAAFRYRYKGLQQSIRAPDSPTTILSNAARATVDGGEIEANFSPWRSFQFGVFATLLDAKFDEYKGAIVLTPIPGGGNGSAFGVDVSGKYLIGAPKNTLGVNARYTVEGPAGEVGLSVNAFHAAKSYWDVANRLTQPAYTLTNAELRWEPYWDRDMSLAIWVKNLGNDVVYNQITASNLGDAASFQRPRSYGVTIVKSW